MKSRASRSNPTFLSDLKLEHSDFTPILALLLALLLLSPAASAATFSISGFVGVTAPSPLNRDTDLHNARDVSLATNGLF